MIKGLYSAFTAMEAAWQYQDVLANNIANANTAGFKREIGAIESFQDVLLSQHAPVPAPISARIEAVIGQIGTGAFVSEFVTDYTPGTLQPTGQTFDLALDEGFFAIEDENGEVFYTRDGRFGRDAAGDLVTSHGLYVLADDDSHITLPAGAISVDLDGIIRAGETQLATLQVVDFSPVDLVRAGEAYFQSNGTATPIGGVVRQGYLEASNTDLVEELTTLLAVQRTYQANQTVLSTMDDTMNQAAGQLGTFQ
jgi:flagellar basal-body rod protein FlgG